MPILVVEKGPDKGRTHRVAPRGTVTVGRDPGASLALSDAMASRRQFRIEAADGAYTLRDLGSSNGTLVNGERVEEKRLEFNDRILVGQTLLSFLESDERRSRGVYTGRTIGGYRVQELIGRGGMGTVYKAIQVSLERPVALKVLSRELTRDVAFIRMFRREARSAGSLNHPNIVQVFDVGESPPGDGAPEGVHYISMEYLSGGSVDDLLSRQGALPVARALAIARDAARGLDYAERRRIIHRDIKPDNLLLSEDGVAKICDLGIAESMKGPGPVVQASGACGSPYYIAPEQARNLPIDHRVDIYSLGVSLYQMLSGRTPFLGSSPREVILKHLNEDPPPLMAQRPGLPAPLCDLVHRMMSRDPSGRPASAGVLLAEMEGIRLLEQSPGTTTLHVLAEEGGPSAGGAADAAAPPATGGAEVPVPLAGEGTALSLGWLKASVVAACVVLTLGLAAVGGYRVVEGRRLAGLQREAARARLLDQAEAGLEAGELDRVAAWLKEALEGNPVPGQAARGAALQARLAVLRDEAGQRHREADARAALDDALTWATAYPGRREEAALRLERVAEGHAGTEASLEASREAARLRAHLAEEAERETAARRREEEARAAFAELAGQAESLAAGRRFGEAMRAWEGFPAALADTEAGGEVAAAVEGLRQRADAAWREVAAAAGGRLAADDFEGARSIYHPVEDGFGLEDLAEAARRALREVERSETIYRGAARQALLQRDEAAWAQAEAAAGRHLTAFELESAAASVRAALGSLQSGGVRSRAERRLRELELARDAVSGLCERIRGHPGDEAIRHEFGGVWGVAVDADPAAGITFRVPGGQVQRVWTQLGAEAVTRHIMASDAPPADLAGASVLALHAGERDRAEKAIRASRRALDAGAPAPGDLGAILDALEARLRTP
ncbi:MAG: protein kinase [Planctomycetes bacterium]|nr:protein kinase [Planctomycetota bacterium]